MKKYFTLLLVISSKILVGQSIEPIAVSAGGDVYSQQGITIQFTVGETSIESYVISEYVFTQGFHQPHLLACDGDFDWNGFVNTNDLLLLTSEYGCTAECFSDLTGDGVTNTQDLLVFLSAFGGSCFIP